MAIRVKARSGESTDQMMRRFKKLCEKEGLTKDIKRKEFFEKPSERRRRAARKSVNRRIKEDMPFPAKGGFGADRMGGGGGGGDRERSGGPRS